MALITDLDDRSLVEQHHAGDEDAFRLIVERHHRSMYANALRRLHDDALAEDAVQEALLRAFRALPRFNGDYHLDAWLHRILTNVCHDIGRRQGRDTRLFDKVSGEHEVAAPPADDPLEAMPREQLERALDSLPESYREVLLLRFVDELSYSDVAIKAGITEENARARVSRGRAMLRRMLDGASAAVLWLIPPLRRTQITGGETDLASQHLASNLASSASPLISQATPAAASPFTQAGNIVAQAVPGLVQAAPAVASSAPTMGKAAVAVGIAASVAIPAGVAVEKRMDRPQPATAAPAEDAETVAAPADPVEVTAPPTSGPSSAAGTVDLSGEAPTTTSGVSTLGDSAAVGATIDGATTTDDTSTTDGSTTTSEPEPTTDANTSTPPPADQPGPSDDGAGEESPPPPPGEFSSNLTVVEAGPRLELDGDFTLSVDGNAVTGTIVGKLLIGDADPKAPEAPREVEGDLVLQFADGTTADLRIRGEVTSTTQGPRTIHDLAVMFRLDGGTAYGLSEAGDLTGTLETRDGTGELVLSLPGAPASEPADS